MLTKSDFTQITKIVQEETKSIIQNELKPIKKSLKNLEKKTDHMLDTLDKEQMDQRKRLKRIENHLQLPPLS